MDVEDAQAEGTDARSYCNMMSSELALWHAKSLLLTIKKVKESHYKPG